MANWAQTCWESESGENMSLLSPPRGEEAGI